MVSFPSHFVRIFLKNVNHALRLSQGIECCTSQKSKARRKSKMLCVCMCVFMHACVHVNCMHVYTCVYTCTCVSFSKLRFSLQTDSAITSSSSCHHHRLLTRQGLWFEECLTRLGGVLPRPVPQLTPHRPQNINVYVSVPRASHSLFYWMLHALAIFRSLGGRGRDVRD